MATNGVESASSSTQDIHICDPIAPESPTLIQPSEVFHFSYFVIYLFSSQGSTIFYGSQPLNYMFQWTGNSEGTSCQQGGAVQYRVKIDSETPVANVSAPPYVLDAPLSDGPHWWKVEAFNGALGTDSSTVNFQFCTLLAPGEIAEASVSPPNGGNLVTFGDSSLLSQLSMY